MEPNKSRRKPYPSDLTTAQFALLVPLLARPRKKTGRPPADPKEVVDGILYILSTGCRWRDLPHDFRISYGTCYGYFRKWIADGTWDRAFEQIKAMAQRKNLLHWRNSYLDTSAVKSKKGVKTK